MLAAMYVALTSVSVAVIISRMVILMEDASLDNKKVVGDCGLVLFCRANVATLD